MTISFKDIMQKYYDDEKLGIKKEDAPANATGVAVAGTGDDSSTVVVKKKKKPYDGRTREAKAFLKRMTERQAKLNKEEIELDEKKKLRLYRVSGKNAQGNIEAKNEKEAEKLARKKGIRGKLSITDRGPVTDEIPSYESVELGEKLDKEDEPKVKKIIGKLKKASDAHAGQAKDLEKAMNENEGLDEFNKMTVTVNDPKQRKKVFDDLKKQKRLDVSMGPGKTIKVDGKGKALNLFAKDIMNFYDAEIKAEEIEEDAKMAKQSDDNLKSLMKKFRDMEKKDPKMPSTQFMIKRLGKEMKKRGLKEEVEFDSGSQLNTEKAKEFHLFDNEKEAQAFAKKSGGKLVKGVNKSKGKFAVVIEEVKTSFIDDIKEKMSTYSSDLMLNESNLKIVQDIVKRKSAKNIKFKDGSLKVDMFTASALSQIYDKVNTDNKKKMEKMMNGTKDQFMKLAKFALSKVG